jgi:hypothetical protein
MSSTIAINVKEFSVLIQDYVAEAEAMLQVLRDLEEQLSTVHELVLRENTLVSSDKSELLSGMWMQLTWNRHVSGYEDQLAVLKNVDEYWERAMGHTLSIIQTLERIGTNLEAKMVTWESEEVSGG